MVKVKPFQGLLANIKLLPDIISLPYDCLSTEEARNLTKWNKFSFLRVEKPEIDLPEDLDPYS